MILSPELGANLAGQERDECADDEDEADELSNSGVSTVNSTKVKHHSGKEHEGKFMMDQVKLLKIENAKLLTELLESQKNFQSIVKAIPQDQGMFSDALRNLTHQLSTFTRNFERSISFGYFSDDQNRKPSISNDVSPTFDESPGKKLQAPLFKNPHLKSAFNARQSHDARIIEWLVRHGFDEESRTVVANADFTYEDIIYESDKDDIRRIGLRWKLCQFLWDSLNLFKSFAELELKFACGDTSKLIEKSTKLTKQSSCSETQQSPTASPAPAMNRLLAAATIQPQALPTQIHPTTIRVAGATKKINFLFVNFLAQILCNLVDVITNLFSNKFNYYTKTSLTDLVLKALRV